MSFSISCSTIHRDSAEVSSVSGALPFRVFQLEPTHFYTATEPMHCYNRSVMNLQIEDEERGSMYDTSIYLHWLDNTDSMPLQDYSAATIKSTSSTSTYYSRLQKQQHISCSDNII